MADDDRRPVDAPGHLQRLAGDLLGLELRPVVGRGQALALVEHVLAEEALVVAGRGHRGDVVERPDLEGVAERDGVAGAADVEHLVALVGDRHVVDGREVEEVLDLAAVLLDPGLGDPEQRLAEVARDDPDALLRAPGGDAGLHLVARSLAHQDEDVALAGVEQPLDQVPADEARRAGHEVRHGSRFLLRRLPATLYAGSRPRPPWDGRPERATSRR